ncbi:MAG: Trehalose/maltose import ATP-binding protein MalK [Methanobacterium sp. PtaU1.Bin242]|nr:MAG: Trehalose/maltose import ATP-binding protein MalK [Methanobacterium sp. PtaU1.Bin242]
MKRFGGITVISDTVLNLNKLHRFYGDFEALSGISLEIKKGQIFGYLGPNGSGKTTTIKLLLGLIKPSSGSLTVLGEDPYVDDARAMDTRRNIGSMLEFDGLYEQLTGLQNLVYWAELYGLEDQNAITQAKEMIDSMKLSEWAGTKVAKYSFGMRKRLALARAMVCDPDILILDEPTVGVDPESRFLIRNMIKDLAAQGKTIFFSSHDLEEVQKVCSHIAILKKGKLIFKGTLGDVINKLGRFKLFIRLKSSKNAYLMANKLHEVGYDVKKEGPLISFYPEDDLDMSLFTKEEVLDTWKISSSLEDVYLKAVADEEVET